MAHAVLIRADHFRRLGTPISSHLFFLCALSISERIGAANNCIYMFEAPRRRVMNTLITTCTIDCTQLACLCAVALEERIDVFIRSPFNLEDYSAREIDKEDDYSGHRACR